MRYMNGNEIMKKLPIITDKEAQEIVTRLIGELKLPDVITSYDIFADEKYEVNIFSDYDRWKREVVESDIEVHRGSYSQHYDNYYYILDKKYKRNYEMD